MTKDIEVIYVIDEACFIAGLSRSYLISVFESIEHELETIKTNNNN
jgi:hypothetical protein